jgi:DHA1 family bicyclomycin/chloramphenicol resistance-like MFS transporter
MTSQLGAWLGGHFGSTLPLTAAISLMSVACVSTMIFLVPRSNVTVSKAMIEEAEEDEAGVM